MMPSCIDPYFQHVILTLFDVARLAASPDTGVSLKPTNKVPSVIPTAGRMRNAHFSSTVSLTTPVLCSASIVASTPTEVRALLAPCATERHMHIIACIRVSTVILGRQATDFAIKHNGIGV